MAFDDPQLARSVVVCRPKSLQEAYEIALRELQLSQALAGMSKRCAAGCAQSHVAMGAVGNGVMESELAKQVAELTGKVNQLTLMMANAGPSGQPKSGQFFMCRRSGHIMRECLNRELYRKCDKPGH